MSNRVDFDKFTDNYNDLLGEQTKFFSASEEYFASYKVGIVKEKSDSPVKRLLEYGCGIGRNIPFLQKTFPDAQVFGSDISVASLDVARESNPDVCFFVESGFNDTDEKFDLIFVAGVFHHIPPAERYKVTERIVQRLSKNGMLFVFEHNPFNPVTRRIVNTCPYDADAVLLKPSELVNTIKNAGLTVIEQKYCLFIPSRYSWLAPLERWLGWLPLGGQYWVKAVCQK